MKNFFGPSNFKCVKESWEQKAWELLDTNYFQIMFHGALSFSGGVSLCEEREWVDEWKVETELWVSYIYLPFPPNQSSSTFICLICFIYQFFMYDFNLYMGSSSNLKNIDSFIE